MKKYLLTLGLAALAIVAITGCENTSQAEKEAGVSRTSNGQLQLSNQSKPLSISGSEADKVSGTNYVVIFDDSGSMENGSGSGRSKFTDAKKAMNVFFKSINTEDTISIVSLNHGGVSGLANSKKFLTNLQSGGGTPLGESLRTAHRLIQQKIVKNKGYGNYVVIALTDGDSSDRVTGALAALFQDANADIIVKTIGFQVPDSNPLNSSYTQYFSASSGTDLTNALTSIQAESTSFQDASTFK